MTTRTETYDYNGVCPKCGKPYIYIGDPIGDIRQYICTCLEYRLMPNMGWICPRCGRANSPYSSTCPCGPSIITVTYTSGGHK